MSENGNQLETKKRDFLGLGLGLGLRLGPGLEVFNWHARNVLVRVQLDKSRRRNT